MTLRHKRSARGSRTCALHPSAAPRYIRLMFVNKHLRELTLSIRNKSYNMLDCAFHASTTYTHPRGSMISRLFSLPAREFGDQYGGVCMSDFGEFVSAVFWHWQRWAGGSGFGGALMVFLALYERFTGRTMGKRVYISVFIIGFLFLSFYMAWRDQYHATQTAEAKFKELTQPKLSADFNVIIGPAGKTGDSSLLTIDGAVKNEGAPSVIYEFGVAVKLKDGAIIPGRILLMPAGRNLFFRLLMCTERCGQWKEHSVAAVKVHHLVCRTLTNQNENRIVGMTRGPLLASSARGGVGPVQR